MRVSNWTGVIVFSSGRMYTQEVTWPPGQQLSSCFVRLRRKSLMIIYRVCLLQPANWSVAWDFSGTLQFSLFIDKKYCFLTITNHSLDTSYFLLRWTQHSFSLIVHSALPFLTQQGETNNTFPLLTGRTTTGFHFRWINNLKISKNKLKYPWHNKALNITDSSWLPHRNKTKHSVNTTPKNLQITNSRKTLKLSRRGGHG